ncbi:hypothetical protein CC78DRAFT_586064 [Lojkania enalia]|uniref:Uncharacterized protein n=1 Tax=Lojkania enalia TaxID=147567 RepID=A0A9P4N5E3_9PLEO|nr:hypothetical protein CC78DRAFT_586064 [Didymosphaeria enalia]
MADIQCRPCSVVTQPLQQGSLLRCLATGAKLCMLRAAKLLQGMSEWSLATETPTRNDGDEACSLTNSSILPDKNREEAICYDWKAARRGISGRPSESGPPPLDSPGCFERPVFQLAQLICDTVNNEEGARILLIHAIAMPLPNGTIQCSSPQYLLVQTSGRLRLGTTTLDESVPTTPHHHGLWLAISRRRDDTRGCFTP